MIPELARCGFAQFPELLGFESPQLQSEIGDYLYGVFWV